MTLQIVLISSKYREQSTDRIVEYTINSSKYKCGFLTERLFE